MTTTASNTSTTRWHVLGAGAIGCLWAASLAASGGQATLIGRSRGADYHGVTLETAAGEQRLEIALESADSDTRIERLLVCTKAYDVLTALEGVARRLGASTAVVLLQNGMGFHDQARTLIGSARLYCGLSTEGAWCPQPFHVRHAGRGTTLIGRYPGGTLDEVEPLAAELRHTGLEIRAVADIQQELWRKLAVNCAINALTAVHGCHNGALLEPGPINGEFVALCSEIARVLAALGHHTLAAALPDRAASVARDTAENRSSMLQDLKAGRRTEIDFINGFLCTQARAAGVAYPLNAALLTRIQAVSAQRSSDAQSS